MSQEVLAVDAGLCHRGCPILEEPHDADLLRDDPQLEDQIHLSMHLVKGVAAVLVSLPKLCGVLALAVNADCVLVVSSEGGQVKEAAAL